MHRRRKLNDAIDGLINPSDCTDDIADDAARDNAIHPAIGEKGSCRIAPDGTQPFEKEQERGRQNHLHPFERSLSARFMR